MSWLGYTTIRHGDWFETLISGRQAGVLLFSKRTLRPWTTLWGLPNSHPQDPPAFHPRGFTPRRVDALAAAPAAVRSPESRPAVRIEPGEPVAFVARPRNRRRTWPRIGPDRRTFLSSPRGRGGSNCTNPLCSTRPNNETQRCLARSQVSNQRQLRWNGAWRTGSEMRETQGDGVIGVQILNQENHGKPIAYTPHNR